VNKDQKPVIGPVEANTDLFARLDRFLPEIQKANQDIRSGDERSTSNKYVLELPEYECYHFFVVSSCVLDFVPSFVCSSA